MNLKSPSGNSFEKSKNRGNDSTVKIKGSGTVEAQKNLKSKKLNTILIY